MRVKRNQIERKFLALEDEERLKWECVEGDLKHKKKRKREQCVVCHLGETYSKAYEFFYEDIALHKLPVLEELTA